MNGIRNIAVIAVNLDYINGFSYCCSFIQLLLLLIHKTSMATTFYQNEFLYKQISPQIMIMKAMKTFRNVIDNDDKLIRTLVYIFILPTSILYSYFRLCMFTYTITLNLSTYLSHNFINNTLIGEYQMSG